MTYEEELETVKRWAQENHLVTKAYFFGSRMKGTNRADSDFDIAVEIIPQAGDSNLLATWIFEKSRLTNSLQKLLSYKLDLQWTGDGDNTSDVDKYLSEASIVVYESFT